MPPKAAAGDEAPAGTAGSPVFAVGQRCLVQGRKGEVKFYGEAKFAAGIWVGVALEDPVGKNDGIVQDVRYFQCDANRGIFVRPNNVLPDPSSPAPAPAPAAGAAAAPEAKAAAKAAAPKRTNTADRDAASPKAAAAEKAKAAAPAAAKSGEPGTPKAGAAAKKSEPGLPQKRASLGTEGGASPASPKAGVGAAAHPKGPPAKAGEAPSAPPKAEAAAKVTAPAAKAAEPTSPKAAPAAAEAAAAKPAASAKPAAAAKPPAKAGPPAEDQGAIKQAAFKAAEGQDPEEAARIFAQQEEKAKVQQQIKELTTEVARLEKLLKSEIIKLTELGSKGDALQREADQLERVRDQALSKRTASNTKLADLTRQADEAEKKQAELLAEEARLAAEKARLQQEKEALEKQEAEAVSSALDDTNPESEKKLRVQCLRQEIALERSQRQLMELELEEVTLEMEDAKLQVEELAGLPPISEQHQVLWHKKALWSFYEEHATQMRLLRRREAMLERAAKRAKETKDGQKEAQDVEELRHTVDSMTQRLEHLTHENEIMEVSLEERLGLRQEDLEMLQAQKELEEALMEELAWKRSRTGQLEALATRLYQGQKELHARLHNSKGTVARLEVRLQTLKAQAKQNEGNEKSSQAAGLLVDPAPQELATAVLAARVRADAVRAEAWAASIPTALRDEAELGYSFHTLCALHRCLSKAEIFSQFIQETFIEDSVLSVLQLNLPMSALIRANLASSQLAYAAAGVLGRLHGAELERFKEVIRKPAVVACGDGEGALDAAIGAASALLVGSITGDDSSRKVSKGMPEVVPALNALVAQLFSVQTSVFKDEPFASWQCACYVSQTVRASCAAALYTSDDAGGSRRRQWQQLYSKAHRIIKRLAPHMKALDDKSLAAAAASQGLLTVEPNEPPPPPRRPATAPAAECTEGAADAGGAEAPEPETGHIVERDPNTLAAEGHLTQALLDGLARQAVILNSFADAEPQDDRAKAKLDKAMSTADGHFDAMITLIKSKGGKPKEKVPSQGLPQHRAWTKACDEVHRRVQLAEKDGPLAIAEAQRELSAIIGAYKAAEAELAAELHLMAELERKYSAGRIEAEQYNLALSQVTSLTNQMKAGALRKKYLEEELKAEAALVEEKDTATQELRKQCKELNLQIAEAERRLQKRYNSKIPVEEVIALRRTCMRQQREILFLSRHCKNQSCKELLADEERKSAAAAARKRTMSAQSKTLDIFDDYDPVETMQKCWLGIQAMQKELLLEQARATLLNLQDADPRLAVEQREAQMMKLAQKVAEIRNDITKLLQRVANPNNQKKGGATHFASVALTRFLKETSASVDRGPMAKIAATAPKTLHAVQLPGGLVPSMPVLSDVDQLMSIHHALL